MHEQADPDDCWFRGELPQHLRKSGSPAAERERLADAVAAAFQRMEAEVEPLLAVLERQGVRLARGFQPPAGDLAAWVVEQLRTRLAAGDPFAPVEAALAETTGEAVAGDGLTARVVERVVATPGVQAGARLVADAMTAVAAGRASGAQDGTGLLAGGAAALALPGFGPLFGALASASPDGDAGGEMPDPQALRDLVRAGLLQVLAEAREAMLAEVSSAAQ